GWTRITIRPFGVPQAARVGSRFHARSIAPRAPFALLRPRRGLRHAAGVRRGGGADRRTRREGAARLGGWRFSGRTGGVGAGPPAPRRCGRGARARGEGRAERREYVASLRRCGQRAAARRLAVERDLWRRSDP